MDDEVRQLLFEIIKRLDAFEERLARMEESARARAKDAERYAAVEEHVRALAAERGR